MPAHRLLTSRPYRHEYRRWTVWDRGGGPEGSVFIAGSGRSGTTWVEELVNHDGSARILFEPFRVSEVPQVRVMAEYSYLRPNDARYVEVVGSVLAGYPRHNRWVNHQNFVTVPRWRIVKEIRAHGWLGWMGSKFPQTPQIFVIRHPIAVAASQERMGWSDRLDRFTSQPNLVADHLEPYVDLLASLESRWDRLVGRWCVENLVALRTVGPLRSTLVLYEELVTNPGEEGTRVLRSLGRSIDPAVAHEAATRPSKMARGDSAVRHSQDLLSQPFLRVSAVDRARAIEIVTGFGLGDIYGDDPMPDGEAMRRLWSAS